MPTSDVGASTSKEMHNVLQMLIPCRSLHGRIACMLWLLHLCLHKVHGTLLKGPHHLIATLGLEWYRA